MPLSDIQTQKIRQLLSEKIENKLESYERETRSMPFLARIVQDSEKIAAYSFIHSIATSLGMSIYEDISVIIAEEHSDECYKNYGVGGVISDEQKEVISGIIRRLRNGDQAADIQQETRKILRASARNGQYQKSGNKADFYMRKGDEEYLFEIKTAKPNIDVFEKSKQKLLEWIARKRRQVHVFLAIPYNPYHPHPYARFTEVNMMDPPHDFLVGDEYWDFIGGKGTFQDLLDAFDEIGKSYKNTLNEMFRKVAEKKIDSY